MGTKNNFYIFIRLRGLMCFLILFSFLWFVSSGCTVIRYSQQLGTLKALGASQKEIQEYLDKQERLFHQLIEDVKNERLKPGISKESVLKTYGTPILSKEINKEPLIKERLLYRHPTRAFTSDRIYLYFDKSCKLTYWEYKPFKKEDIAD